MSWLVQPRLVNGPFDDPGLFLDFRFGRRAMLFDLGDVSALSARELLRVSHVFVSHTHMDHMAGFDRLFRTCLHRPGPLTLVGPLGFIDQVDHRIRSFTWNLLGEESVDFRLTAMEFDGRHLSARSTFHAREAFRRTDGQPRPAPRAAETPLPPSDLHPVLGTIWEEDGFRVEGTALDHGIPSLAFALQETVRVNVWRGALESAGLPVGPWLGQAKQAVRRGDPDDHLIDVPGRGSVPLGELRERIIRTGPGQRVAYVTDAAPSQDNRRRIVALGRDADQLFIEAVFLRRDRFLAEATRHLTAWDAGEVARESGARFLTVFHHSARYLSDPAALRQEAEDAFGAEARTLDEGYWTSFGACWSGTFVLSVESGRASDRAGFPSPSSRRPERRLLLTDLLARPRSCGSADFSASSIGNSQRRCHGCRLLRQGRAGPGK